MHVCVLEGGGRGGEDAGRMTRSTSLMSLLACPSRLSLLASVHLRTSL